MPIENGQISLHIFVDNASIEIFGNQGKIVLSNLIFPDSTSNGMEISAAGGEAQIINLDIWELGKANFLPTQQVLFDDPISIFPNPLPAGEKLMVEMPEIGQNTTVTVSDAYGKVFFQSNIETLDACLQIPNYAFPMSGIYFLVLSNGEKNVVRKIIRQ